MRHNLIIKAKEVMADIRSAAWMESEVHPELNRHRRHEMADICEEDNIATVWRDAGLAVAQVRYVLHRILALEMATEAINVIERPEVWNFRFLFPLPHTTLEYLKEKIHEYIVATVMAERAEVIIPECAPIWKLRAKDTYLQLRSMASISPLPQSRVRRPLWPV